MKTRMKNTRQYTKEKKWFSAGFTLVEIMIVMTIVGILGTMLTSAFLAYNKKQKIYLTKARLDQIHESMQNFLEINGRYPCPASFTLAPTDANFGMEGDSNPNPNEVGCLIGAGASYVPVGIPGTLARLSFRRFLNGRFNGDIRIGMIPIRTLNLPDEFAVDAWGGKLTYAVMVHQATTRDYAPEGFLHNKGGIRIVDENGNSVINPPDSAHYIVLSHGADQNGARVLESNNINDRKNPCGVGDQAENCDDDAIFTLTSSFYDRGRDLNDDIAIFEVQRRPDDILARGTILAFDSPTCPQGWVDYMNTTERGSFLMGLDPAGNTARHIISPAVTAQVDPLFVATPFCTFVCPMGCPPACPVPSVVTVSRGVVTGEYDAGDIGEYGAENIPAYIALRYCVKQ